MATARTSDFRADQMEVEVAKNRGGRHDDDDDAERTESEAFDDELDAEDEEFDDVDVDEDEDFADAELDPERETVPPRARRARQAAGARPKSPARATRTRDERRPGLLGRLIIFVREVFAELQKVIRPTRRELLTYTTVVVIFVAIMMTFVALLDLGFAKVLFLVFGGNKTQQ